MQNIILNSSNEEDALHHDAGHLLKNADTTAAKFWRQFGFEVDNDSAMLSAVLPANYIAFETENDGAYERLWHFLNVNGPHAKMFWYARNSLFQLFQLPDDVMLGSVREAVPEGVTVHGAGDTVELAVNDDFKIDSYKVRSLADLTTFSMKGAQEQQDGIASATPSEAHPVMYGNPLAQYSLKGHLPELEAAALETKPLLGGVVLAGQATIVFAQPGSGKTLLTIWLLMEAITAGRILGGNVYYMNADDSSSGVADKLRLLEDVGAHMVVPGLQGFSAGKLVTLMQEMVRSETCRGVVIVVDTLKKVVDTMDKKVSAAFGQIVRECVALGATFIGLGHTRKNPSAKGQLVHAGTTDLLEDADAACILTPLDARPGSDEKVVQFQFIKRRGANVNEAFAYADGNTASYDELVASVRRVDPDNVERLMAEADERSDEPVIEAVAACIAEGTVQKMQLARAAGRRAKVSTRTAIRVIERHQGDDPTRHRWSYSVRDRGAKIYRLLTT